MSITTRLLILTFWSLMVAVPLPALAGQPGDHEKGFFTRTTAGITYAQTENEEGSPSSVSGVGLAWEIAVGATVKKNLAIYGTYFAWSILPVSTDAPMSAFGGGLTNYFMPKNVYVSASAGAARLGGEVDSDWGFALNFTVGKEWWTGRRLGLERGMGIAASVGYHSITDPDVDSPATPEVHDKWDGFNVALLFTGTLN